MSEIEIQDLTVIQGIEKIQEGFLFKGLNFDETRMVAGVCQLVSVHDRDVIIEEKAVGQALYLIIKGQVMVYSGDEGSEKTLAILSQGDIFGEMSLIEDSLTSSSVRAIGDTQLLRIDKRDLEHLMHANVPLAAKIYRSFCLVLSDRLRKANRNIRGTDIHG